MTIEHENQPPLSASDEGETLDTEAVRRRMLVRLGVYGAATAPVLLGALRADRAMAQTTFGGEIPGEGTTGGGGGTVIPR